HSPHTPCEAQFLLRPNSTARNLPSYKSKETRLRRVNVLSSFPPRSSVQIRFPRPRFRLEFTCRFESEEKLAMKHLRIFCLLLVLSFAMGGLGQSAGTAPKPAAPTSPAQTTSPSQQAPQPPPTIAGVVD